MNFADIDHISVNGTSNIHKSGVIAKLLFTLFMVTAFLITKEIYKLVFLFTCLLAIFVAAKLNLKQAAHLALYPAFFSLFFAFLMINESFIPAIVIILKAVGGALTMILLIMTTPYVDIFSVIGRFLPGIIVDIFFFTYRSFFMFLEKIDNILKSIRLRGGYSSLNIIKNIKNISGIIGLLIIHSIEASENMHKIYRLRGYNGKLPITGSEKVKGIGDFVIIIFGFMLLIGVIIPWKISLR